MFLTRLLRVLVAFLPLLVVVSAAPCNVSVVQSPMFQPGSPSTTFAFQVNFSSNVTTDTVVLGYSVLNLNATCCVSYGSSSTILASPSNGTYTFNATITAPPSSALLGVEVYLISSTAYAVNPATAMSRALVSSVQPISVLPGNTLTFISAPSVLPTATGSSFNLVLQYTTSFYWNTMTSPQGGMYIQCQTVPPPTPEHTAAEAGLGGPHGTRGIR